MRSLLQSRHAATGLGLWALLLAAGAPPPPPPEAPAEEASSGTTLSWPEPPFAAWVAVEATYVRLRADAKSPAVGLLRRGDFVTVRSCEPSCGDERAWAILSLNGESGGAVRLSFLKLPPAPEDALVRSSAARFFYGRVREGGTDVFAAPEDGAPPAGREEGHRVLSFRPWPKAPALIPEWLERAAGGFVPAAAVDIYEGSVFQGELDPAAPLAFVLAPTRVRFPKDSGKGPLDLTRYERFGAQGLTGDGRVRLARGSVPRARVRLAFRRPRPREIPAEAKWVHVDLSEQVLTAYEGDTLVYATLVSAGKDEEKRRTPEGLFRVWRKAAHETMQDTGDDPYYVEEVPWILFFQRSLALHGTFWHDSFGTPGSHGCVNLSLGDASWLFEWAPPVLPLFWHSIMPDALGVPTLWVKIEKAPPGVWP